MYHILEQVSCGPLVPGQTTDQLLAVPAVVVSRRRTVEAAAVGGAENAFGHYGNQLVARTHASRIALSDDTANEDLSREWCEGGAGLLGAPIVVLLFPGPIAGVVVAAAEADVGAEHANDFLVGAGAVLGEQLRLSRFGCPNFGELDPYAAFLLPLLVLTLGQLDWQNFTLPSATIFSDDNRRNLDARPFEGELLDDRAFRNFSRFARFDCVDLHFTSSYSCPRG